MHSFHLQFAMSQGSPTVLQKTFASNAFQSQYEIGLKKLVLWDRVSLLTGADVPHETSEQSSILKLPPWFSDHPVSSLM